MSRCSNRQSQLGEDRVLRTRISKLSLKVTAEGVETAEQSAFLCGHGCDEMQGYYFSEPVREAEIARMLRAGKKLGLRSLRS